MRRLDLARSADAQITRSALGLDARTEFRPAPRPSSPRRCPARCPPASAVGKKLEALAVILDDQNPPGHCGHIPNGRRGRRMGGPCEEVRLSADGRSDGTWKVIKVQWACDIVRR